MDHTLATEIKLEAERLMEVIEARERSYALKVNLLAMEPAKRDCECTSCLRYRDALRRIHEIVIMALKSGASTDHEKEMTS